MNRKKHIHFVGIKGVGMTPLAIIAKEAGYIVTGSDIEDVFITDDSLKRAGITPLVGFDPKRVESADLVITTGAHGGFDNVETKAAIERHISVWTQGQAVGEFMKGTIFKRVYDGISIAGTHGKTTTTAMISTMFSYAKQNPSYVIGTSSIPSLGLPGHFGKGRYFIAEADEYATEPQYDRTIKFLWQHPKIIVISNIELDHPDIFSNVESMREVFLEFANRLPEDGLLVACGDDTQVKQILKSYKGRRLTYGFAETNDFVIKRVSGSEGIMFFHLFSEGHELGEFMLNVFGEHNALDAAAAIIVGLEVGLDINTIKKSLKDFSGSRRRSEYIGTTPSGALLYDDYAHHPTEIRETLMGFKKNFPKKRIVCIFQPHTYSRTKELYNDFVKAFTDADSVVITDIYPSLREEIDPTISSEKLAMDISQTHNNTTYQSKLSDVVEYINKNAYKKDSIILTMGAGDVYKIHQNLKQ